MTGFVVAANQELRQVEDPEYVFGCESTGTQSFSCEDIHSGADGYGQATVTLAAAACSTGHALHLRITPYLDFEGTPRPAFTLTGPC